MAQTLQRLLPLSGGQLPALAHGLSRGVAVETLLIAVPCAVLRHGADHQVHAVGRRHIGGIVPQTQGPYLHRRLLPPCDGDEALHQQSKVLPQLLRLGPGVNAAGGRHGLLRQTFPIRLLHLTVRGVVPLCEEVLQGRHEVGQQNGPAEIQRDQLGPVQQ